MVTTSTTAPTPLTVDDEPEHGSVVIVSGLTGTAWQRFYTFTCAV